MTQRRPRRSRAEWVELISLQEASGMSAVAFAAEKGLTLNSLYWWRSQLKQDKLKESLRTAAASRIASATSTATWSDPRGSAPLTERLVDRLVAESGGLSLHALALELGAHFAPLRHELQELELLGLVTRRGRGAATLWFAT